MIKDRIARGAKLLDEKVPGWIDKINLEELNLEDICDCVVGQAFPDQSYCSVICDVLWPDLKDNTAILLIDHGFAIDGYPGYHILTQKWKDYIRERRLQKVGG
jgi:hypothetical protein